MRRLLSVLAISLALLSPAALRAQAAPDTSAAAVAAAPAPASASESGLPQRVGPPRTLKAYWHVFIAFAIAWILLFGYALSLGRRFARVERELRRLG
jgi:CcmD family protein